MQTVEIDLSPGETVYSQTHAMAWMNDGVDMHTNTGGGLFAGLKRSLTGGSFLSRIFLEPGPVPMLLLPRGFRGPFWRAGWHPVKH